jgi:hypothetical protein
MTEPIDARLLLEADAPDGMPRFARDEASLICALDIALREEEFTRDESIRLIEAWLQGPRAAGSNGSVWRRNTPVFSNEAAR